MEHRERDLGVCVANALGLGLSWKLREVDGWSRLYQVLWSF